MNRKKFISGIILLGSICSILIAILFYTHYIATSRLDPESITKPMIANQISNYIFDLRAVPTDVTISAEYLRKVQAMSSADLWNKSVRSNMILRYQPNHPLISVTVNSVIQISADIWQVNWEELLNGHKTKWQAIISFSVNNSITDKQMRTYNILGILVNDITISQESV
jgi:type IV secretory pathway TrbF-like protein